MNCVPQTDAKGLTRRACEGGLIGSKVFADDWGTMRSHGWAPIHITDVPIQRGSLATDTSRGKRRRGARSRRPARPSEASAPWTPRPRASSLRTQAINFCCSSRPVCGLCHGGPVSERHVWTRVSCSLHLPYTCTTQLRLHDLTIRELL